MGSAVVRLFTSKWTHSLTVLPSIQEHSARVTCVLGCNPGKFTLQGTNTYVVGTGRRRLLIDTGESNVPAYTELLKSYLDKHNVEIEKVICTHWHRDHVGGVGDLKQLRLIGTECEVFKFPRHGTCSHADDPAFTYLDDNQILRVDGATLRILYTPGHTDDHIALFLEEENSIFSGDCVLGEGTAVFEDLYDYMSSLKHLLRLKPTKIYPGHGPLVANASQKIEYYIEHRKQREKQIILALTYFSKPVTTVDLVVYCYKDASILLYPAAAGSVNQHLLKLEKEGVVEKCAEKSSSLTVSMAFSLRRFVLNLIFWIANRSFATKNSLWALRTA